MRTPDRPICNIVEATSRAEASRCVDRTHRLLFGVIMIGTVRQTGKKSQREDRPGLVGSNNKPSDVALRVWKTCKCPTNTNTYTTPHTALEGQCRDEGGKGTLLSPARPLQPMTEDRGPVGVKKADADYLIIGSEIVRLSDKICVTPWIPRQMKQAGATPTPGHYCLGEDPVPALYEIPRNSLHLPLHLAACSASSTRLIRIACNE